MDGSTYAVRRASIVRGTFVLERDGRTSAEAKKTSAFRRAFDVQAGPERWVLMARSAFRRTALAEFPDAIPLPLQVFITCLVLLLWKRDADAAAAGG